MLATTKVGVDLAGKDGILGDIGAAGIFVEGKQQQPGDANDDAQKRQVRRDAGKTAAVSETEQSCFTQDTSYYLIVSSLFDRNILHSRAAIAVDSRTSGGARGSGRVFLGKQGEALLERVQVSADATDLPCLDLCPLQTLSLLLPSSPCICLRCRRSRCPSSMLAVCGPISSACPCARVRFSLL